MHKSLGVVLLLTLSFSVCVKSINFEGFHYVLNILRNEFKDLEPNENDIQRKIVNGNGDYSSYTFLDYITSKDESICRQHRHTMTSTDKIEKGSQLLKVKCFPNYGNGTVLIPNSVKEIVNILSPRGNCTKKDVGNCALIFFYARSCPASAVVAPHINALAKQYPDIKVAAFDALKFHSFNTEFGIVGVPTVMLFHQGRPIVKFNDTSSTVNSFVKFLTKHTGINSLTRSAFVASEDFIGPLSIQIEHEPDKYLYIAWIFIILCGGYYFSKCCIYIQIVEMIKRNWIESSEQLERF